VTIGKTITVVGAGIAGLWQALSLLKAGYRVRLLDSSLEPFADAASRLAGAMIAPECEAEAAPRIVRDLGRESLALWKAVYPAVIENGTLVVASARDRADLTRFQRMTERHHVLNAEEIGALEPQLADRFDVALFFGSEAHMDATAALFKLLEAVDSLGGDVQFGASDIEGWNGCDQVIDCRGFGARDAIPGLRGVRGERIVIRTHDVALARPVRLLHPRQPIYVVPQGDGRYIIGATVIEREDDGAMTLRSALELLGSAFALHPGFAEAEVLDMGAGVRPAFADNTPRIRVEDGGRTIRVNGMYRHGFLLAPVLAQAVVAFIASGTGHPLIEEA
jgi:glycine oxidase